MHEVYLLLDEWIRYLRSSRSECRNSKIARGRVDACPDWNRNMVNALFQSQLLFNRCPSLCRVILLVVGDMNGDKAADVTTSVV